MKVKSVRFNQDIMLFLNYYNFISHREFDMWLKGNFLIIQNTKTNALVAVPLYNVGSMDIDE